MKPKSTFIDPALSVISEYFVFWRVPNIWIISCMFNLCISEMQRFPTLLSSIRDFCLEGEISYHKVEKGMFPSHLKANILKELKSYSHRGG